MTELRESLSIRAAILGDEHALTLQTTSNLATALWRKGDRPEALALMQRAETGYGALGGDGERELGLTLSNHAAMQLEAGDLDGAASNLANALELQTKRLGDDHPAVAVTIAKLAVLNHARHRDDEARKCWEDALRIRRGAQDQPRELADALYGYGAFLSDIGECEQALPHVEESIDLHRSQGLDDSLALGRAEYVLGGCLSRVGTLDAAREHLQEAARLLDASPGATPGERSRVHGRLKEVNGSAGG